MHDGKLIDLKDVCVRMQEAWNIRATVQLSMPDQVRSGYAGLCITRFDMQTGFPIQVCSRLKRERRIWVLAHELRHVMQSLSGALVVRGGKDYWSGAYIDRMKYEYNNLPWEVDANTWADSYAPAFYAEQQTIVVTSRSWADIPWGK
jgi:hypothetical protein